MSVSVGELLPDGASLVDCPTSTRFFFVSVILFIMWYKIQIVFKSGYLTSLRVLASETEIKTLQGLIQTDQNVLQVHVFKSHEQ